METMMKHFFFTSKRVSLILFTYSVKAIQILSASSEWEPECPEGGAL